MNSQVESHKTSLPFPRSCLVEVTLNLTTCLEQLYIRIEMSTKKPKKLFGNKRKQCKDKVFCAEENMSELLYD